MSLPEEPRTGARPTTLAPFTNLAAGSSLPFTATLDTSALGSFTAEYTLLVSDENIPGATAGTNLILDLTGTASAAPEPAAGLILMVTTTAGLIRRRR